MFYSNPMNPEELRKQKQALVDKMNKVTESIQNHLHSNITNYRDTILYLYSNPPYQYDFRTGIFAIVKGYLEGIIKINHEFLEREIHSVLLDETYFAQNVYVNDTTMALYCINMLKLNIINNEQNVDNTGDLQNNFDVVAHVDLLHNVITFFNKDAILSCISFKYGEDSIDSRILKLISRPFKLWMDLNEMKLWAFKSILDCQIETIISNEMDMEKIETLNSFKLMKERGVFTLIEANSILNKDFIDYAGERIIGFISNIESKYSNFKMKGLMISYFFMLNPGLIEFFDMSSHRNAPYYYFIKWMDG